ncbi:hypothetical protein ADK76_23320 [Streptomyces griseoflavus]|uniref:hypothetical protein n=1 Tax=Streptomyces rimosus TaxID=1927 RepID=UPI0004C69BB5|nr:hypothetical protein [Streptomyces rimosus]KOG54404.1 hypothetical protein ADK76_23320 [Streptomyces griseoflavus]
MADSSQGVAGLKRKYATRLSEDLDHNAREEERIHAEFARLQQQLVALHEDRAFLVGLQRTLEVDVPVNPVTGETDRETRVSGVVAGQPKSSADGKTAVRRPALGDLARDYLQQRGQPCSAGEATAALAEAQPERRVKVEAVRTALETLVTKGLVRRGKQDKSVSYSVAGEGDPRCAPAQGGVAPPAAG